MVRKAHTKPVTPQMYRHFAAVTLTATIALAMISSGENREAVAAEVSALQKPTPAPAGQLVQRNPGRTPRTNTGDTFDDSYGSATDIAGSAASFGGIEPAEREAAPLRFVPAGFTQYGVSLDVWNTMTLAQQEELKKKREASLAAAQKPERKEQIEALMAASRARSGGALGSIPD